MTPSAADRDLLFKSFGRAWFRRDVELLYQVVTPDFEWASHLGTATVRRICGRDSIATALIATGQDGMKRSFEDVVYHHAPEATFMTFRVVETDIATGARREEIGVERYTFRDGRIALKDVYRKLAG